jgi:hypothetical protein
MKVHSDFGQTYLKVTTVYERGESVAKSQKSARIAGNPTAIQTTYLSNTIWYVATTQTFSVKAGTSSRKKEW